jgi:hypothetical protein
MDALVTADAEDRAGRLGAAMLLLGLVREPAAAAVEALQDTPLLTAEEWEAWRSLDAEDRALALACLNAEYELRDRQWSALEAFGAAYAAGRGDGFDERIKTMPAEEARRILIAAYDLGWHFPMPEEG